MTFQQWINSVCHGKPVKAVARIEQATGEVVTYSRVYRYYTRPAAMPAQLARVVERATNGACSFAELVDADAIAARFEWPDPVAEAERVQQQLTRRVKRLGELEARRARVDAAIGSCRAELESDRARLAELGTAIGQEAIGRRKRRGARRAA